MPTPERSVSLPVLYNREIVPDTFLLGFKSAAAENDVMPGQFIMMSFPDLSDPLLPRPFAVFDVKGDILEVLYKRVGKGTSLLSRMRAGDPLRVLYPLGNGFIKPPPDAGTLILAGGIGIASVHLLYRQLVDAGQPVTLLYGARSKRELLPGEVLSDSGSGTIHLATDNGEAGFKGNVYELFLGCIEKSATFQKIHKIAYACGPPAMLQMLSAKLTDCGIQGYFSLEARMACGYGVCQGCAVSIRDRSSSNGIQYRKVCSEGPVFAAEDIIWEAGEP